MKKTELVSNTNPSGIIEIIAAADETTAFVRPTSLYCRKNKTNPRGIITNEIILIILFKVLTITELVCLIYFSPSLQTDEHVFLFLS